VALALHEGRWEVFFMAIPGGSRFRYVDAADLSGEVRRLDGIDVRNSADEKLGEVDGFIVDRASQRPYYVVVDAGGWMAGQYLLPINHGKLVHDAKRDDDVLLVDLDRRAITQYPTFDKDEFDRLSDSEMREFETRIGRACCPDEAKRVGSTWTHERWAHYEQPDWWSTRRVAESESRPMAASRAVPRSGTAMPERGRIVAMEGQPANDRAQPGDVLGIESGGEETHLGDTARDEERRVEDAEHAERRNERG
jgi:hypothetical protein